MDQRYKMDFDLPQYTSLVAKTMNYKNVASLWALFDSSGEEGEEEIDIMTQCVKKQLTYPKLDGL